MQEIVIKIPEEMWEKVKDGYVPLGISKYLKNGTVLPKGYGRIIDYGYVVDAIDDWVNAEEYRYTNATYYLRRRIANVPAIIEADRSEE